MLLNTGFNKTVTLVQHFQMTEQVKLPFASARYKESHFHSLPKKDPQMGIMESHFHSSLFIAQPY